MFKKSFWLLCLTLLAPAHYANADLTHEGWDLHVNGYVEMSNDFDSTRTYQETITNAPVAKGGLVTGDNGRTTSSLRQSRIYLKANIPETAGWQIKGWLEGDFLGFDPAFTPSGAATNGFTTESTFLGQGTFRLRNAFVDLINDTWKIRAGQWWSLFGYQPYYLMFNTSTSTPINVINRTPQIWVSKQNTLSDNLRLQWDVDVEKPTQRDAEVPNVNAGVKLNYDGRKAGRVLFDGGDFNVEPTSIGVTGTFRNFSTPNPDQNEADKSQFYGSGVSVSALIPILVSPDDKTLSNSLTFQGEFIYGSGLGDVYNGLSVLPQLATGTTNAASNAAAASLNPNLDPSLGAYNASGNFELVTTQSFTAQLQYILPFETTMAVNVAYGRVKWMNSSDYVTAAQVYDFNEFYSADFVYQFTKNFRAIAEVSKVATHYIDGTGQYPGNTRYGVSTLFLF